MKTSKESLAYVLNTAKLELFWAEMAEHHAVYQCLKKSGISKRTWYAWRKKNPEEFKTRMEEARQKYVGKLSEEIHRRAVEGYEEPVYYKGEVVGSIRKYSDMLLALQARRHEPAYAVERKEITGKDGGAIKKETSVKLKEAPKCAKELLAYLDEDQG